MLQPRDIQPGAYVRGLFAEQVLLVLSATTVGPDILQVVKDACGQLTEPLLYPGDLDGCTVLARPHAYTFDGDANTLRGVSEALRIHLAHLFGPTGPPRAARMGSHRHG